ncbi:uncharacterized protein LOC110695446 [Chenopodium quinoa]|uniref:uncharacterized protein LOC110695446 n=1 Tax=Chenopodium quinoa TaxID=63459 RepID=UPI000B77C69F|nr:uncharacterized protein LOC110695446 [Chenopodium quinoa]
MKVALWNCRGLGQADSPKIPYINTLVRSYGLDVVCLLETMLPIDIVAKKLVSLPFLGYYGIDAMGLSGGMFICWFSPVGLKPVFSSQNVYLCKLVQGDEIKYVMFVYGSPHVSDRLDGDFNQVEYVSDKLGGNHNISGQMDFINWRLGLDLMDVPFSGPHYTWTNNRKDSDPIFERLDRAYGSPNWFIDYPDTKLTHQPILFSGHAAVILTDAADPGYVKSPYRIENWCLSAPAMQDIIHSVFSLFFPGSPMFVLSRKLSVPRDRLLAWCVSHKKAWGINWKQIIFEVQQASQSLNSRMDRCLFLSIKNERVEQAHVAYIFWQQRAKVKWDSLGDSHSRLLFSSVQSRKRKNRIFGLRDSAGCWHSDQDQIASITLDFYKDLYSVSDCSSSHDSEWWDSLQLPSLSTVQQAFLMRPFTSEDIKNAIFSIDDSKSPGPDGFPSAFFKSSWHIVGPSVIAAVQHFFAHGYMLKDWNRTFLALLPKVDHPEFISQFRPIGLCNVIYKCVAKCLTARLRLVLPSLVADFQNAFVPSRLLSDNALIAHEVISYMNKSKARMRFFAAIKSYMNKAYDRVNWDFLCRLLQAYGFPPYWIHIIRQCFSTVSYQVLVNGNPLKAFRPQCGLRQGDPLSSYLFVLCMEILSAMLRKAKMDSLFKGICISRGAPSISHLFFTNDSLFFFQVTPEASENLTTLLSDFCSLSGQRLSTFASLGLFAAAKLVIINSVLVASFNHVLSVFQVPSSICSKVDNRLARLWWKSDSHTRGLALRSKSLLHLPKGMGGLGIRSLNSFNSVLLARQSWRIRHHPQLLVSRLLSAKYPTLRLNQATRIPGSSWGFQGLLKGFSVLSNGIAWKVGSGSQVRLTEDSWVPGDPISFRDNIGMSHPSHVSFIINPRSYAWDTSKIRQLFDSLTASRILALERPSRPMDDFVYWKFSKDGRFSTKSAYAMVVSGQHYSGVVYSFSPSWWKVFWGLPLLPKLQCFCWKFLQNALPLMRFCDQGEFWWILLVSSVLALQRLQIIFFEISPLFQLSGPPFQGFQRSLFVKIYRSWIVL